MDWPFGSLLDNASRDLMRLW